MPSRLLFLWLFFADASFVLADEFDELRLKWRDTIVGAGYDTGNSNVASRLNTIASQANGFWGTMDTSPTRTYLWSDAAGTDHIHADLRELF